MKKCKLDLWLKITQMVSMLLIPLVIAFVGWFVQKSISDSNTQKDYIEIAVNILNDPDLKNGLQILLKNIHWMNLLPKSKVNYPFQWFIC